MRLSAEVSTGQSFSCSQVNPAHRLELSAELSHSDRRIDTKESLELFDGRSQYHATIITGLV